MPHSDSFLNDKQVAVLQWVIEGCPDGFYEGFAHRVTARALEGRGLLRIHGHGKSWRAEATERGTTTLERASTAKDDGDDVGALILRVIDAGGALRLDETISDERARGMERRALTSAQRPDGKQLRVRRLGHWGSPPIEWSLWDYIPDRVPLGTVPVPSQIMHPHAVVTMFRSNKDWSYITPGSSDRTARILQALASEFERRGHSVATPTEPFGPKMIVTIRESHQSISIREIAGVGGGKQAWPAPKGMPLWQARRNWVFVPTGRLEISLDGSHDNRQSTFKDVRSWKVEDRLGEIVREIEVAAIEHERALKRLQASEERAKAEWDAAMASAREQLQHAHKRDILRHQLESHREANEARLYAAAIRSVPSSTLDGISWADWIDSYADTLDPLKLVLQVPADREYQPDDLKPFLGGLDPHHPARPAFRWNANG